MVWIWCHSIDPEYETNAMLLLNFFTTLRQGCAYATILPWIIHICRSSQSWHNVVEMVRYRSREDVINLTLRVPRCIKAGVATFIIWCEVNLLSKVKTTLAQRCDLTSQYRRWEDVVILTSQFQSYKKRCQYTINSTPWVKPTNIEETLEQRYNFDVVTSTSLQCCALAVRCCDLTTTLSQRCLFAEEVIRNEKLIVENDQIVKIFTKHFLEAVGSYLQSQKVWASIIQNLDMAEKKLPFGIDCWQFKHL